MPDRATRRRIVMTGATGFVGRHLAARLRRAGHEVIALVRPGSRVEPLARIGATICPVTPGETRLAPLLRRHNPFGIVHLAAHYVAQHEPADIEPLLAANIHLGLWLIEGAAEAGVTRLVTAGTAWQAFSDADPRPANLYAATKAAFDAMVDHACLATPLRAITLRLYDTFGPDDERPKLMAMLRHAALAKSHLPMSPGEQVICPLFVSDAAEGFVAALDRLDHARPSTRESHGLPGPQRLTLRDFVALYEEAAGCRLDIGWGERPYRRGEVMQPASLAPLPGWRARVPLAAGLARLWAGDAHV